MTLDSTWFTEIHPGGGSAFSLRGARKIHEEQTPYQHLAVYETDTYGRLLVLDGFVMLTDRDNFLYHEMMAHPALYTHTDPRKVVIIGGGDCGTLKEVLQHPEVQEAWQIEIDERVTRVAEQYFPDLCTANNNPRANFYFGDGVKWMDEAAPGSIDVIIVDSTDPIGPAEGLFRAPFYASCHRALRAGGILVQQSESPLYHLELQKRMRDEMRQGGFSSTATLQYPQPVYPTGWWSSTLAGKQADLANLREQDAAQRPFKTRYYSPEMHRAASVMPPFFLEAMEG